jgi:ParB family chromosome partitioning protein
MRDGFISMGHGRAIININSHSDQIRIYKEILSKKLSVRATESLVKNYNNPKSVKTTKLNDLPEFVKNGVPKIAAYFGHKINIKMEKNGNGKILIPFHSKEDYDRILKLFKSDE